MIYCLTLLLLSFVIINYKISPKEIFNPAFVVTGSFGLFSFLCCIANVCIGIDINSIYTIFILLTGMIAFTIVNYFQTEIKKTCLDSICYNFESVKIYNYIGIVVLFVAIYVNYKYIVDFAGAYGVGGDFFECMLQYKAIMTFSDASEILFPSPWYRNLLSTLSNVFAYLLIYLFFRDRILYRRINYSCVLIIILYIVFSLMGGGRTSTFRFITAMLFLWVYFRWQDDIKKFSPRRWLIKMFAIIVFISVLFILFAALTGRAKSSLDVEYVIMSIFVYVAAPIFNLDTYLENPWHQTYGIWGELTFIRLINWLGAHFDNSKWVYPLDLPFLYYQGFELGNVYTTFYAFYYDFGYMGVVVLSLIMAKVAFWCYRHIVIYKKDESISMLWVISYAYFINDLFMLPFSNRFYETLANVGTWYFLIGLFCLVKLTKLIKGARF